MDTADRIRLVLVVVTFGLILDPVATLAMAAGAGIGWIVWP